MTVKLICAHGLRGEFGLDDGLPWDCPEDLANFKNYTSGCVLVTSGSTFSSLPRKLPGRKHIVLSNSLVVAKNGDEPDFILPTDMPLEALCRLLEHVYESDVCVIGGRRQLIEAAHFVDEASVTEMCNSYEATHIIDSEKLHDILSERMDFSQRWLSQEAELFSYGI